MILNAYKHSVVLWQESDDEDSLAEPALLIEGYTDVISITQGENVIQLNYGSVKELMKAIRMLENKVAG